MDSWQPAGNKGVVWEEWYSKDPEGGWVWGNHREATPEQLQAMQGMVRDNKQCFAYSMDELHGYKQPVNIGPFRGQPAYVRPKQYSPVEEGIIHKHCVELRDAQLIRQLPLNSKFAARPTIAAKKDAQTGEWTATRFCVNFIKQNKGTETIPHALPLPESIFRRFGKARSSARLTCAAGFISLSWTVRAKHALPFGGAASCGATRGCRLGSKTVVPYTSVSWTRCLLRRG